MSPNKRVLILLILVPFSVIESILLLVLMKDKVNKNTCYESILCAHTYTYNAYERSLLSLLFPFDIMELLERVPFIPVIQDLKTSTRLGVSIPAKCTQLMHSWCLKNPVRKLKMFGKALLVGRYMKWYYLKTGEIGKPERGSIIYSKSLIKAFKNTANAFAPWARTADIFVIWTTWYYIHASK